MRISDWSSDVCSSDLLSDRRRGADDGARQDDARLPDGGGDGESSRHRAVGRPDAQRLAQGRTHRVGNDRLEGPADRSEEHTSELQSLMRISYAVFCLKKKNNKEKIKQ